MHPAVRAVTCVAFVSAKWEGE